MSSGDDTSQRRGADSPAPIETLISHAKAGSTSSLGHLLAACRPRLVSIARKEMHGRARLGAGPSDVVQDALVNATKDFRRFRGGSLGELLRWMFAILGNRLAEIARKAPRNLVAPGATQSTAERLIWMSVEESPSPSSVADSHECAELIRCGLSRLSVRDQQVLRLRFEEQLTFAQIGERLELNEDATRMVFARAVKRLRRLLPSLAEA